MARMTSKTTQIEEQIAILQAEMGQLSEELYAQQKEIAALTRLVTDLKARLGATQPDSGILKPEEDSPPPHY